MPAPGLVEVMKVVRIGGAFWLEEATAALKV